MSSQNEYLKTTVWAIEKWGWSWEYVYAEKDDDGNQVFPYYVYTVGLAAKGLPEIVVVGLDYSIAIKSANELIHRTLADREIAAAAAATATAKATEKSRTFRLNTKILDLFEGVPAMLVDVPAAESAKRCGVAHQYAEFVSRPPEVIQLVWPDDRGRFPFEEGVAPNFIEAQPVLQYWTPPAPESTDSPGMR